MQNIFSGAEAHVVDRIAASSVSTEPFEHCVVDDVLPIDLLEEIHHKWPSEESMMTLPETGRVAGYGERHVLLLEDQFLSSLTESDRKFWRDVAHTIIGANVIAASCKKFKAILQRRIGHLEQDKVILSPEMLVVSDHSNYKIGPHTDTRRRFISLLYYLSTDPKYRSYGTSLYTPKDPKMPVNDEKHYEVDKFTLHTRIDYKPNRAVIFPRTDRSYHGVEPIPVTDCDRRLIIVNVRAPQGATQV